MVLDSIFLFWAIVILIVGYRLLFYERINWRKLFHARNCNASKKKASTESLLNGLERFQKTGLYQGMLTALNLEDQEIDHFESISDHFFDFKELSNAIRAAGLESSNLVIGIDFSASNEWQGRYSFDGKSLHFISKRKNPYQQVISSIATTLEPFDDDNLIPVFGFGDENCKNKSVFPLIANGSPLNGLQKVLESYEDILDNIVLSGPTSYAPIINKAVEITKKQNSYHILIIIGDGQVEKKDEEETKEAIINASFYPLSIVLIGVGDGPWDRMREFDDKIPLRQFDNFQFYDFNQCIKRPSKSPELAFALNALMEIPHQYKKLKELGLIPQENIKKDKKKNSTTDDLLSVTVNKRKKSITSIFNKNK